MVIVIAHTVIDREPVGSWRHDLGEHPKFIEVTRAKTAIWLNDGTEADVEKAKAYAASEDAYVFTYPTSEPDPLKRAKVDCIRKYSRDVVRETVPGAYYSKEKGPGISPKA